MHEIMPVCTDHKLERVHEKYLITSIFYFMIVRGRLSSMSKSNLSNKVRVKHGRHKSHKARLSFTSYAEDTTYYKMMLATLSM